MDRTRECQPQCQRDLGVGRRGNLRRSMGLGRHEWRVGVGDERQHQYGASRLDLQLHSDWKRHLFGQLSPHRGRTVGLQLIYGSDDAPFGPYGGDANSQTGNGAFSVGLFNGQSYTMRFYNFGNLDSENGFGAGGSARALFNWRVTYPDAVPEPASWAMLIAGFGLVGGAARRRRMVAA